MKDDAGAGSALAVAVLAGVVCISALVLPLQFALARSQTVSAAADAAALAAADTLSGAVTGQPCENAAVVARANAAHVDACVLDGLVATVRVASAIVGIPVTATATAGPPPVGND